MVSLRQLYARQEYHAKYFSLEGCRGHLGKQLIEKYHLDNGKNPNITA